MTEYELHDSPPDPAKTKGFAPAGAFDARLRKGHLWVSYIGEPEGDQ